MIVGLRSLTNSDEGLRYSPAFVRNYKVARANFETCCLSDVYLPNLTSFEEAKDVVKTAYRICKHSLLLGCHQKSTEEVVHKNTRMGIGMTGYMQATEEQKSWLDPLYEYIREYDKEYSKMHGLSPSIKVTTTKP